MSWQETRWLQLRAGEWFESTGDSRRAVRHLLAAQQPDRALAILQDRVVTDFLHDPAMPTALDLSTIAPSLFTDAPDQLLALAAAAIERGDPATLGIVSGTLQTARGEGFLNTVVTTAPQMTSYLVEHSAQVPPDHFMEQLIGAALQVRAAQPARPGSRHVLAEPLTAAELRILNLLPTSTYLQMAATLFISRNTVKTHLRSIYQKLDVALRTAAIERAVELRLI